MPGIYIGTSELKEAYIGTTPIKEIYVGTDKVRPAGYPLESIVYKMNADSSGNLYVPIGQRYNAAGNSGNPYSWKVSVDGGTETTYTGNVTSTGGSITISGYTAGTEHLIMIKPTVEDYLWARAYGWANTAGRTYLTEIVHDITYMGFAKNATETGSYFRFEEYRGCNKLLAASMEEYMPNTVTTIGDYFRRSQYQECSLLADAPDEFIPSSVTSIGYAFRGAQFNSTGLTYAPIESVPDNVTITSSGYFRQQQYMTCTKLSLIKGWKDTTYSGSSGYFRYRMFAGNSAFPSKTIKVISNVGNRGANDPFRNLPAPTQVQVPSAYLTNFKNSTLAPRSGISDDLFIGY